MAYNIPGIYYEYVKFHTDEEKEEAYKHLSLWKNNILENNKGLKQKGHDQIVLRANIPDLFIDDKFFHILEIKIELIKEDE